MKNVSPRIHRGVGDCVGESGTQNNIAKPQFPAASRARDAKIKPILHS
jgi:hypothetical protein